MRTKVLSMLLCICMFVTMLPMHVTAETTADKAKTGYFQAQLLTQDAQTIYRAIDGMNLQSGTDTIALTGVQTDNWDALFADFVAARDAYMLDHNLFYVDFDKFTLKQVGSTVTMGIGREDTYFQDGFTADTVEAAIAAFDERVTNIANAADAGNTMQARVKAAYDAVIGSCSYALEKDAKHENVNYVRTAYGALVTGEAVCAGYARAVKAVLDKMGIENVLVQGVYDDGTYTGPHMWNAVRMDDHRWYMLDATMEGGLRESTANNNSSESYFLVTGLDELMEDYQPNGVISLSAASMEFSYPDLSIKEYEDLSDAFTANGEGYTQTVSYKSMGLAAAQATTMKDETGKDVPIYILSSINGTTWYYYERLVKLQLASMGYGEGNPLDINLKILKLDEDTYFQNFSQAYFGVTTVAPAYDFNPNGTTAQKQQYQVYTGGLQNVHDVSLVGNATDFAKTPPYITEKIPYNSRLDQGKTYQVKVVYSETLKKANANLDVGMTWVQEVNGGSFESFEWDGSNTVTFTLTTGTNFGRTTNYYFELQNLVGTESGKAPNAIGFSTYNNNVFDCPKVDWDTSKIHADTPALIANEDLSTDGWTDAAGNPLGNLPKRLSLVASTIEDKTDEAGNKITTKSDMIDAIEEKLGEDTVLSAQTYNISLTLCSGEVAHITGEPVQVYVPFPAGYNYQNYTDGNTTFKAYHFDKEGTPEEITCKVVEGGIIMYCTEFSPFAVVALEGAPADCAYGITVTGGTASIDGTAVAEAKEGQSVTITANAAAENQRFKKWQVVSGDVILNDVTKSTTTFTMSANAVVITAVYADISTIDYVTHNNALTAENIPEAIMKAGFTTPDEVEQELLRVISEGDTTVEDGDSVLYEVTLQVNVNGKGWVDATPENFPKGGISVSFDYPDGTNKNDFDFVVAHMFSMDMNGYKAGEVELPRVILGDKIQVTLNGLSPVMIAWTEKPDKDQDTTRLDAWYYDVMMLFSQQFTIQSAASAGGSIVSAQGDKVYYDRSRTVKIVPDAGYEIVSVIVDGKDMGAITEYTFKSVKEDHSITAVFAATATKPADQ